MPGRRPTTGDSDLGASEPYSSGTGGERRNYRLWNYDVE